MPILNTARRGLPALVAVLAAMLLVVGASGIAAAQAPAAPTNPSGFVRLGHLAPDVGPVDVYLVPFGGQQQSVVEKAPYGSLTKYQTLAPGDYTVAMRPAGTPAAAAPMLSTQVTVAQGKAFTVLVTGAMGALKSSVLTDDLTPPAADAARVRLIQGSAAAQKLTVTGSGGVTLARDVAYGTATGYADVRQGRWTLQVTAADGSKAMSADPVVDLRAGSVNSLLVTDAPGGGFAITPVVDAAGINASQAPVGGVETGGGGTATVAGDTDPRVWVGAVVLLLVAAGAAATVGHRRTVAARR